MRKKWLFSQGLSREFFQVVPDISEHTILHLFWLNSPPPPLQSSKSTKKVKKLHFMTNFKQFLHFLPSPYFGTKFQILLRPSIRSLSKLDEPKFRFQNLCLSKVIEEKPFGGVDLTPSPGIRRVKNDTWTTRIRLMVEKQQWWSFDFV